MQPGVRIGRFVLLSVLGRGGMGEVWKAHDSKLNRDVAIKLLPAELAREPEWLARLESEATLLAALNHPNVAAIHGIEEHEGSAFLVLELVDGITLADRLHRGSLGIEEALELAQQIASGLEAAHERGVVHRDLKPANICLTLDGRAKVLDFGLGRTLAPNRRDAATRTSHEALVDATGGTAPYMSPEQARGETAERQADIWSLGAVLFEMLTGASPFARATTAETLARVLEGEPDYAALPAAVPDGVRALLRRCLEKDQRRRFHDMADVRIAIEDAIAAQHAPARAARHSASRVVPRALVATGGAIVLGFAALGVISMTERISPAAPAEPVRFSFAATGTRFLVGLGVRSLAIAKDGSRVAQAFGSELFVRRLSDSAPIAIPVIASNPFFSPDGEWVGFVMNGVQKVPSDGGQPVQVASSTDRPLGGDWREDDTIVYATTVGVYVVAASGGSPRLVARPDPARGELMYAWPHFLPDGRSVLITIVPRGAEAEAEIARLDLTTLEIEPILRGGVSARYVPTGHLIYATGQALMAIRFDLATRATRGEPVVLPDIAVNTADDNGASDFAIADNGTLAFIGPRPRSPSSLRTLAWVDRDGTEEPVALDPGSYVYARVAHDGTRIAVDVDDSNRDIWVWDIGRETFTRLTDGPTEDMTPVWSPDSRRVFFSSDRTGNFDVYSQAADGSSEATVEVVASTFESPTSVSPDGSRVVVTHEFNDVAVLDREKDELQPLLKRDANDRLGEVSPDGRYVAYESDESGTQFEIYVRSFPDVTGLREQLSIDGGRYPRWGPPGSHELYYVALDGSMMAVPVELTPSLKVGRAAKLFDFLKPLPGGSARQYDVSDVDGRFLIIKNWRSVDETVDVEVVLGWFAELGEQAP